MSRIGPGIATNIDNDVAATLSPVGPSKSAQSILTRLATWITNRNIAFLVISVGMIVMLLWAGSFKMTAPGAEGIIPLVSNSPLIWWHFKLFGPYIGSDIIGLTGMLAADLLLICRRMTGRDDGPTSSLNFVTFGKAPRTRAKQ